MGYLVPMCLSDQEHEKGTSRPEITHTSTSSNKFDWVKNRHENV